MSTTYSVPGVSCGHCKSAIEGEVGKLDGISMVEVDVDAKTMTVEGDVDEATLAAAVDEAGYDLAGRA